MDMNFNNMFDLYLMIEKSSINKKIEKEWKDSISFIDIKYITDNIIDRTNNNILVSLKINEAKYLMDVLVNGYDFIKRWETPKLKFKVEYF